MQYEKRWEIIGFIGGGGQGKVHRVLDKQKVKLNPQAFANSLSLTQELRSRMAAWPEIREGIVGIFRAEDPVNHGALKVLHAPDEARNYGDQEERLRRELEAMHQMGHPNLLKVVDVDLNEKWFVSQFYQRGTLAKRSGWFTGEVLRTLTAIRPLVDGVAALHESRIVHRDIKPQNIFIDDDERLVLGDFGLVFFQDQQHSRLTATYENAGSTDWMPPWAARVRWEDVRPNFDVFSLGKTIWSMVAQEEILPFWYHRDKRYDIELMFPGKTEMKLLNGLLDKCIVEREQNCLTEARVLLGEIDRLTTALKLGGRPIDDFDRPCRECGFGKYELIVDRDITAAGNYGLNPTSQHPYKIFACNHCGHIQLFLWQDDQKPPGWGETIRSI